MEIGKAISSDVSGVLNLVHACISDMNLRGTDQWNEMYPRDAIFVSDVEKGTLYTMKDGGQVVGIMVLSEEQDSEYEAIQWTDTKGKVILVHRLAVHPEWQRRGVATQLMDFAEGHGRKNGYTSMRLDTYSENHSSLRFFEKRGYEKKKGAIYFPETNKPYYCYEVLL